MGADAVSVRERLERAIGTGELVGIVYYGGSQPGAFREIEPLQIDGEKVWARCHTSSAEKVFSIDKIELRGPVPTEDDRKHEWGGTPKPAPYTNVAEVRSYFREQLDKTGFKAD